MRRLLLSSSLLLLAPLATGDEIYLKSGRKVTGVVVQRTETTLVVEVGPGRVGFPLSAVARVVAAESDLSEYLARAARLEGAEATAWVALGGWARQRGLETQARQAFERALQIDPANGAAQRGLGRELYEGRWLTFAERQHERGLVEYQGEWLTPGEREARTAAELESARARQAEARAQAAEAAAAEAEARAREAEARAAEDGTSQDGGLPWWGVGGGDTCLYDCQPGCPCQVDRPSPPRPHPPKPAPKPKSQPLVSPSPHPNEHRESGQGLRRQEEPGRHD